MSMNRAVAARRLAQLLATDIVGDLLDAVGDAELRDRVQDVTGAATVNAYVSPLRIIWNRMASLSPL